MSYALRFALIFFLGLFAILSYGEGSIKPKQDTSKLLAKSQLVNKSEVEILELKMQIVDLTKTVADTKESFYNSRIYLWAFIIAALALLMVFIGYLGVQSLRNKLIEIKSDVDTSKNGSIATILEIKKDLNKRTDELKEDLKDFKRDQKEKLDKFENTANDTIKQGLDLALQNAIDNIIKGTFGHEVEDIQEKITTLNITIEELKSNLLNNNQNPKSTNNLDGFPPNNNINNSNNAFDDQP